MIRRPRDSARRRKSSRGKGTIAWHGRTARLFGVLRQRYADVADKTALDPILDAADCLRCLR